LEWVSLSFVDPEARLPGRLAWEGWMPSGMTTYEEFRAHLADAGIPIVDGVDSGPDRHMALESGVRVTFDEGRLYSISYGTRREPGVTHLKQVAVHIPSSDLEAIRREAATNGVSISALCSRWIGERVAHLQPQ